MKQTWILIIVLIIWIVIWIVLRSTNIIKPTSVRTDQEIENDIIEAEEESGWSTPQDIPGGLRNACSIYTFPATDPETPGIPTLNKQVLDSLTPRQLSPDGIDCVDEDQIAAKEQQRTCLGSGVNGNVCLGYDGKIYQKGQVETLYVPCEAKKCEGTLGLVSVAFDSQNFPNNDTLCLSVAGQTVTGSKCSLENQTQILRIERANPSTLTENQNGPFARIIDRATGNCVIPNGTPSSGQFLTTGACNTNSGYVWLLLPSVDINGNIAPQQIVFTSNVDDFPSPGKMSEYISQNNPFSIAVDNQQIFMEPYSQTPNDSYKAQILDYQLYELISSSTASGPNARFPFYNWS